MGLIQAPSDILTGRPARGGDLPILLNMLADDVLGHAREDIGPPTNPAYRAAFDAIIADPNQLLAVFEQAGEVVGCLQITYIPGLSRVGMWRGQIESVRVAASARGGGVGRYMFEWAIERCAEGGCGLVQLTSDKTRGDALRFYESLGFTATHEGFKLSLNTGG